jgi:hypothetical protein
MRTRAERQAWWAGLTSAQRDAYISRQARRKETGRQDNPSCQVREANARLDLATERGCFMTDISDEDVRQRMKEDER